MKLIQLLATLLPAQPAFAHCDVPCGIYDPKPAQIAAATVLKMAQKMTELSQKPPEDKLAYKNSLTRMIWTKEEHARKCKEELLILWTDFFKPEHLTLLPDLHETFWQAAKLCSKNKQEVNVEDAQQLVAAVDHIAQMFSQAQASAKK